MALSNRVLVHNDYMKTSFANEISLSCERMGTKTHFEKDAKRISEMANVL